MSHDLDMTNNRANVAFLGSRNDIWHRMGQEMLEGESVDSWAAKAGLNWHCIKVPAYADVSRLGLGSDAYRRVDDRFFTCRSDNGFPLGYVSDRWEAVQPMDVLNWFERYINVDERFELDVAGSLDGGRTIWATARFREALSVAGDKHDANVLMSTTFDGSGSTINQGTMIRTVCRNTLRASLSDKRAVIRTRHNTAFNPKRVAEELATIAQSFQAYKAMGDALAQANMTHQEIHEYFLTLLDVPKDAKRDDMSSRKVNQYSAMAKAYQTTVAEGATGAWAALNAITRYVDHDRTNGTDERVLASSQFGSGDALKAQAVELLMPRIRDMQLA